MGFVRGVFSFFIKLFCGPQMGSTKKKTTKKKNEGGVEKEPKTRGQNLPREGKKRQKRKKRRAKKKKR